MLGAAETNEMSAPGHSFFPGHPIVAARYVERRPWLTITGPALWSGALLYIPANIREVEQWRQEGVQRQAKEGGISRLA